MARTTPPAAANTVRMGNIFVISAGLLPFNGSDVPLLSSFSGLPPNWGQTRGQSRAAATPAFESPGARVQSPKARDGLGRSATRYGRTVSPPSGGVSRWHTAVRRGAVDPPAGLIVNAVQEPARTGALISPRSGRAP